MLAQQPGQPPLYWSAHANVKLWGDGFVGRNDAAGCKSSDASLYAFSLLRESRYDKRVAHQAQHSEHPLSVKHRISSLMPPVCEADSAEQPNADHDCSSEVASWPGKKRICFRARVQKHLRRQQPNDEQQAKGNNQQVVQVTKYGDEVRDQINWA